MLFNKEKCLASIEAANERISDTIVQTPLLNSKWLSMETGCNVYLKMESEQITNSFKLRGATNKIKYLYETKKEKITKEEIVAASSGCHAIACAYISSKLNLRMSIFSYKGIAKSKEDSLACFSNVTLTKHGEECCEAETFACAHANKNGLVFVSPYNDLDVIYGQGTIGVELLNKNPDLEAIFVPVGGGGLISGIALYIKMMRPDIKVIGCQPVNDCVMYESVKAGRIVDNFVAKNTISDGTAGNVETGSITFDICKQFVDEWVLLEEEDIERAVYDMLDKEHKLVEGAAGLPIAALRKTKDKYLNKNVALLICGSNFSIENVKCLIKKYSV